MSDRMKWILGGVGVVLLVFVFMRRGATSSGDAVATDDYTSSIPFAYPYTPVISSGSGSLISDDTIGGASNTDLSALLMGQTALAEKQAELDANVAKSRTFSSMFNKLLSTNTAAGAGRVGGTVRTTPRLTYTDESGSRVSVSGTVGTYRPNVSYKPTPKPKPIPPPAPVVVKQGK